MARDLEERRREIDCGIVFARTNGCQPSNNTSGHRVIRQTQFSFGIDIKVLPAAKPPVIAAGGRPQEPTYAKVSLGAVRQTQKLRTPPLP